jgi:phage gpG-like protein
MISGYIIGDREVIARLQKMPQAVSDAVAKTVDELGISLQRKVVKDYLSGPRPTHLGRVTGRLASSIARGGGDSGSRFERSGDTSTSYVGTNVPYGKLWELGFTKKVGAGARGGPRTITSPTALARYFAQHPPGMKQVGARPFLSPALADMKATIIRELQIAVTQAAQDVMKR